MQIRLRRFCLVTLFAPGVLRGQRPSANDAALWTSYGTCERPTGMVIELRADEHLIQRKTVRLCHLRHAQTSDRSFHTMMAFAIRGGRTFQDEYRTTRAETIRTDVWQAGADTNAVILGVSFMGKRQILLNTLRVLMPGKSRTDTLDRGLTITSYPAPPLKP